MFVETMSVLLSLYERIPRVPWIAAELVDVAYLRGAEWLMLQGSTHVL